MKETIKKQQKKNPDHIPSTPVKKYFSEIHLAIRATSSVKEASDILGTYVGSLRRYLLNVGNEIEKLQQRHQKTPWIDFRPMDIRWTSFKTTLLGETSYLEKALFWRYLKSKLPAEVETMFQEVGLDYHKIQRLPEIRQLPFKPTLISMDTIHNAQSPSYSQMATYLTPKNIPFFKLHACIRKIQSPEATAQELNLNPAVFRNFIRELGKAFADLQASRGEPIWTANVSSPNKYTFLNFLENISWDNLHSMLRGSGLTSDYHMQPLCVSNITAVLDPTQTPMKIPFFKIHTCIRESSSLEKAAQKLNLKRGVFSNFIRELGRTFADLQAARGVKKWSDNISYYKFWDFLKNTSEVDLHSMLTGLGLTSDYHMQPLCISDLKKSEDFSQIPEEFNPPVSVSNSPTDRTPVLQQPLTLMYNMQKDSTNNPMAISNLIEPVNSIAHSQQKARSPGLN